MFARPAEPTVEARTEVVPGNCPACDTPALHRYRVLSEGGWWQVVKCRHCLRSVERTPGPLLGPLGEALQALIPAGSGRAP